jgi:hypothetical protein
MTYASDLAAAIKRLKQWDVGLPDDCLVDKGARATVAEVPLMADRLNGSLACPPLRDPQRSPGSRVRPS